MIIVYILVVCVGTILNIINQAGLQDWLSFMKISLLYIGICSVLYIAIKSQRVILNDKQLVLKVLGMTRHRIDLSHIEEVRKGKMNGSPIIEIETRPNGYKKISPVPYLPFEKDWDEMLTFIKGKCGENVIGSMTLKREKGELRTWD